MSAREKTRRARVRLYDGENEARLEVYVDGAEENVEAVVARIVAGARASGRGLRIERLPDVRAPRPDDGEKTAGLRARGEASVAALAAAARKEVRGVRARIADDLAALRQSGRGRAEKLPTHARPEPRRKKNAREVALRFRRAGEYEVESFFRVDGERADVAYLATLRRKSSGWVVLDDGGYVILAPGEYYGTGRAPRPRRFPSLVAALAALLEKLGEEETGDVDARTLIADVNERAKKETQRRAKERASYARREKERAAREPSLRAAADADPRDRGGNADFERTMMKLFGFGRGR